MCKRNNKPWTHVSHVALRFALFLFHDRFKNIQGSHWLYKRRDCFTHVKLRYGTSVDMSIVKSRLSWLLQSRLYEYYIRLRVLCVCVCIWKRSILFLATKNMWFEKQFSFPKCGFHDILKLKINTHCVRELHNSWPSKVNAYEILKFA